MSVTLGSLLLDTGGSLINVRDDRDLFRITKLIETKCRLVERENGGMLKVMQKHEEIAKRPKLMSERSLKKGGERPKERHKTSQKEEEAKNC